MIVFMLFGFLQAPLDFLTDWGVKIIGYLFMFIDKIVQIIDKIVPIIMGF